MAAAYREGDFADVDIASGVDGDAVRSDEFAWLLALLRIAYARQQLSPSVENAHTVSQTGRVVDTWHAVELADIDVPIRPDHHAVRAMDIVPHCDELSVGVEDLNAMGLAVGNVDLVVRVYDHVVGPHELAGVDSRLPPREHVLAISRILVHTRVAVSVADEDVARVG